MANKFEVQIVALDRFTKTFRDLNNKASRAARPLVNVQRQVGSLAREMHLDKAAKGVGLLSDATVNLTRTLGLSLGPLESVLGAGGIVGGILAAGGAAIALGVRFAGVGFEVARTSQAIGVSTKDLQLWRGAAELAGVDADVMTQTLASMGRTLQNAKFYRDPIALQALTRLGVGIPEKNGVVDQVAALEGISRALSRISDPQTRATLAEALHIPPEALPALIQGTENLERLRQKAKELGVELDESGIKKANEFTTSLNVLKVAAQGTMNTLGAKLAPSMASGMDVVTKRLVQSNTSPASAIWGLNGDAARLVMRATGVGDLINKTQGLLRGPSLTTPAQRTVRGTIGGPAWPSAAGRGANDLSAAENRALDDFTPAERARQQASEDSPENRRQLVAELARTRDPGNRAILQGELNKIDARLHVDVTLRGAPPGTTATTRVASSGGAQVSTRVQYAMPAVDMP